MKQQLVYWAGLLLCLPLLPFLFLQGRRTRARVRRLPEAPGSSGQTSAGSDPLLLVTVGESTVAGVGLSHHREGFTGWIARRRPTSSD